MDILKKWDKDCEVYPQRTETAESFTSMILKTKYNQNNGYQKTEVVQSKQKQTHQEQRSWQHSVECSRHFQLADLPTDFALADPHKHVREFLKIYNLSLSVSLYLCLFWFYSLFLWRIPTVITLKNRVIKLLKHQQFACL